MEKSSKQQYAMLVNDLAEKAKELNCLYQVEEILNKSEYEIDDVIKSILSVIPTGFRYSDICHSKISFRGKVFKSEFYSDYGISLSATINMREKNVGEIKVCYSEKVSDNEKNTFLPEEEKLIKTIADRLGHYILHNELKAIFNDLEIVKKTTHTPIKGEWKIVLDMIRKTDPNLFMGILRKFLHLLYWKGVEEADILLKHTSINMKPSEDEIHGEENKPLKKKVINDYDEYIDTILRLVNENLFDDDIMLKVLKWIREDKSSALIKIVEARESSLAAISDAIRKYYRIAPEKYELSPAMIKGLRVSLLRRFFTEDLRYIQIAKEYVKLTDFYNLIDKMIYTPTSLGKLGGKSSGIFLASRILSSKSASNEILNNIKIPKTWYMASDCVLAFMHYNNLEEVLEQKYKDVDELRIEYPQIVQMFKNSQFPPDIEKGLSVALDDFEDRPIVVRSSSLLEDQLGSSFSGKYKSLFLANQGTKQERLAALEDAIAEVYASTFSPDPILYRAERGLLDFNEEMGVMIQEVVGNKVGKYFLPTYAGVAFSNNEFRWSPRIKREDGLVRIVPGIGTRAVDRIGDDYPILIAPGQPNLRVNVSVDEIVKYSPKRMDVINLEKNEFETIDIAEFTHEYGDKCPGLNNVVSIYDGHMIRQVVGLGYHSEEHEVVVTFNGLLKNTNFIKKAAEIIKTLQKSIKSPVDIEFASDGVDFYLLQCRPQSYLGDQTGDAIPKDYKEQQVIFSASKHISNGRIPEITHIVYVDPVKYSELPDSDLMKQVGKAVSKLNKILPKRSFILMGPGRWGSRGDIKLGVPVTYSDINHTAMLIEIAKKKGSYMPDLSFGTHFFQDLVEASIRYLPLYPDEPENIFNEKFFLDSPNIFKELIPELEHLSDVVKVIDIVKASDGKILKILANADKNLAVAMLKNPSKEIEAEIEKTEFTHNFISEDWKWRYNFAEKIAKKINPEELGVKAIYLYGSTKNANATSQSDIDLIIHVEDDSEKRKLLEKWLEGWSLALAEMNYLRTGIKKKGLLDVQYITDKDIEEKKSYAVKINAVTDSAQPLVLKNKK
jgi:predicted nucleotidyltransferase